MKIRNGFVSNSSSSSFCIVGKNYEINELKKLLEAKGLTEDQINDIASDDNVDCDEVINELFGEDSNLEGYHMSYSYDAIIGYNINKLNKYSDLTFNQFKEKIVEDLKKADPTVTMNNIIIDYDAEFNG